MLVMDSGLGGIAVARALRQLAPTLDFSYVADTAGFPYGSRGANEITARAIKLIESLQNRMELTVIVLACNTLSTLCLAELRNRFPYPFVGTVPAIKVAGSISKTRRFTLLATPNTAAGIYSSQLIEAFAQDCVVDRYGAPNLAPYAERTLLGEAVSAEEWKREIAPAFHDGERRTDAIVLGCTHYPLVLPELQKAAPWEVTWIDSSEAIARRALGQPHQPSESVALVTRETDVARYRSLFTREGFSAVSSLSVA